MPPQKGVIAMTGDTRIGFIGGGNMAEAIIRGLRAGGIPAERITVADPSAERRALLSGTFGVVVETDNRTVVNSSEVVVLAVKPQVHRQVLTDLARADNDVSRLFISIMAGVRIAAMEGLLATSDRVVRVMPNTPALVLAGAAAIAGGNRSTEDDIALTRSIFATTGETFVVGEQLMDAVTGLSGSGPAYVFSFIEALSDAGVKNGLPRETSTRLAAQTVLGAARLLLETGEHPAVLRETVTSPGGTTIAGLHAMEEKGFRAAVMAAVDAAVKRSKELAG
jgi:pyrroline-5-carboxylate reductase